jgi:hypothetical protein
MTDAAQAIRERLIRQCRQAADECEAKGLKHMPAAYRLVASEIEAAWREAALDAEEGKRHAAQDIR